MTMDDLTEYSSVVAGLLKSRKETVAVAESSAAGLISASLLAVAGASAYFMGGGVIYTLAARSALLPDGGGGATRCSLSVGALCAMALSNHTGSRWCYLGIGGNRCVRSCGKPLWRRSWSYMPRSFWTGRTSAHFRDEESGPASQHVGVYPGCIVSPGRDNSRAMLAECRNSRCLRSREMLA